MKIIGVTGGVGAGKSTVLNMLTQLCSCRIVMADDTAKELMVYHGLLYQNIIRLFGKEAYDSDKGLNRTHIAAIIYKDSSIRAQWENIVHPAVNHAIAEKIKEAAKVGCQFFFIEAALLIENNYDRICDELWYIYASESVRVKRLMADRGYSEERCRQIMGSQLSDEEFKRKCDFIIDTGISLENTQLQLQNKLEEYNV